MMIAGRLLVLAGLAATLAPAGSALAQPWNEGRYERGYDRRDEGRRYGRDRWERDRRADRGWERDRRAEQDRRQRAEQERRRYEQGRGEARSGLPPAVRQLFPR